MRAAFSLVTLVVGCDLASDPAQTADGGALVDASTPSDAAVSSSPTTHDVHLRTEVGRQFLSAEGAGGGALTATGELAREWELFHLVDDDGGELESGDLVHLRAYDGASYLQAVDGVVDVRGAAGSPATAFTIVRSAGDGTIHDRATVSLRAAGGGYLSAVDGGGGAVNTGATTAGAWERFVIDGLPEDPGQPPTSQRVIGYLPNWYGSFADWATRVDFSRVTQVNLAFALGDDDGDLELAPGDQIDAFVAAAHAAGVDVFPSLCGGGGDGRIAPHYAPERVDAFVDKILAFVDRHQLDGVDVDVEAPDRMGANYDVFIARLKEKANARGLPISAAVAPWMQHGMSDDTLRSFDFITVMSYDNAGTWTGAGEHASLAQAEDALDFYAARGVEPERIVLGVPFYGYCWGNCQGAGAKYVLYKDILARFPDAWQHDWLETDGATLSYNGVATMKAKTALGQAHGGIMIWELAGDVDSDDERSLLRAIR